MTVSAPQSRLRQLAHIDLPAPVAVPRKAPSRQRTSKTWTKNRAIYDKTDVSPSSILDKRGASFARAYIQVRLAEDPDISQAMLAEELGWGHRSALTWHMQRLEKQELVTKVGRGRYALTVAGKASGGEYLPAYSSAPSLWSRLIPEQFDRQRQLGALSVKRAAEELDARYRLDRDGFLRKRRGVKAVLRDEDMEVELKANFCQIIKALQRCKTYKAAADQCGIRPQTLTQKLETLFKHARERMGI